MANTWMRAWLAALAVLIGGAALVRNQHHTIADVEDEVLEWLLDGTETSFWDRFEWLGSGWLMWTVALLAAAAAVLFDRVVAAAFPAAALIAELGARFVRAAVDRPRPEGAIEASASFPSLHVVYAGTTFGLLALVAWWLGLPKLLWQLVVEVSALLVIAVALDQVTDGRHWPTDTAGSAVVVAVALITAAMVCDTRPRRVGLAELRTSDDLVGTG